MYFNTLNCHIDMNIQTRFKIRSWLFIQLQGSITNQNRSYKYMYSAKNWPIKIRLTVSWHGIGDFAELIVLRDYIE